MPETKTSEPRIRLLPPDVIDKIAAGEVVDRPAAVAKELIENSIDAGARKISVAVRGAPDHFLRVLDDGCGMREDDAHLAIQRHATSKLTAAEDLETIATLGFRGEALPTIARVSKLTLSTRAADELGGVQIEMAGGAILDSSPVGRPPGTTVTVANLFFNTPARRKFLQSQRGEMRALTRIVTSYALARPEIHFLLSHDERELLNLPPVADLRGRAVTLFDSDVERRLLDVTYIAELCDVHGLVGGPDLHRSTREQQTFIVNGRWIQNPLLSHAVRTAFKNRIPSGRFPIAVLGLKLDRRMIDVNVHPTKREIKFSREREVYGSIVRAVEGALREFSPRLGDAAFVAPARRRADIQMSIESELLPSPPALRAFDDHLPLAPPVGQGGQARPAGEGGGDAPGGASTARDPGAAGRGAALGSPGGQGAPVAGASEAARAAWDSGISPGELVPLWQLHNTYIFCPVRGGVMIVDQHVAHERVLYEQALMAMKEREVVSQALLFPETLDLPPDEIDMLEEADSGLERLGFDLRVSGPRSVTVHGVPPGLKRWERGRFLIDLLETLVRERSLGAAYEEAIAASYACHAAVRKGDALTIEEMNRLIDDLFACEVPEACPHGRPVILKLPLEEFDRRFGRL